jgi:hypothetical protein
MSNLKANREVVVGKRRTVEIGRADSPHVEVHGNILLRQNAIDVRRSITVHLGLGGLLRKVQRTGSEVRLKKFKKNARRQGTNMEISSASNRLKMLKSSEVIMLRNSKPMQ